jgi:hypothetical protein
MTAVLTAPRLVQSFLRFVERAGCDQAGRTIAREARKRFAPDSIRVLATPADRRVGVSCSGRREWDRTTDPHHVKVVLYH